MSLNDLDDLNYLGYHSFENSLSSYLLIKLSLIDINSNNYSRNRRKFNYYEDDKGKK